MKSKLKVQFFSLLLIIMINLYLGLNTRLLNEKKKLKGDVQTNTNTNNNDVKTNSANNPNTLENIWKRLFVDQNRSSLTCKGKPEVEKTEEEKEMEQEDKQRVTDGAKWSIPKKKENYYAKKMMGWGPSAYLFDFLDDVMEKDIVGGFKKIFDDAKKLSPDPNYKDPYSLENITQMKGTTEELLKKLHSLMTNASGKSSFDEKSWENSITCGQMNKVLKEWDWFSDKTSPDPGKGIVDQFDFNGDGRLNPKEFIIAMIIVNKPIIGNEQCKNCLAEYVKNTIDPIFLYLDCRLKEKISAENIWDNLPQLRRTKPNTFNFFLCDYKGGSFRTSTVNDFVVKAHLSMDGYLSRSEFRTAILEGYWSRHCDDYTIFDNCKLNMKNYRWNDEGTIDKVCENLKNKS